MALSHLDKHVTKSIWSSTSHVYDFFSVFLERKVINVSHLDLSFIPIDYFDQLLNCRHSEDGQGYLNLLMMLFTEFFQEKMTGQHKLMLPEVKYHLMSEQFLLYLECELLRRKTVISYLSEENLFNPNVKTVFTIDNLDGALDVATKCKQFHIIIREFRSS